MQSDKGRQNIRSEVLQNVELVTCQRLCPIPAKSCEVTYCRDDVYIAISIQRDRIHEKNRKHCKVVLSEPFRSAHSKLVWYAILCLH
jgi:hypothetical protein